MENPHEYDDDAFASASSEAVAAIQEMWQAGGSPKDIAHVVKDALEGERANEARGVTVIIEGA